MKGEGEGCWGNFSMRMEDEEGGWRVEILEEENGGFLSLSME